MHIKECPTCAHAHLRNAINYVLDVKNNGEKTERGLWVGGNSGTDHKEALQQFLETKKEFGKMDARQGYHFVLSFKEGEGDAKRIYAIAKEFCERYLGEGYDYLFAVHTDKPHLHAHIIFNSVSRIDGRKYHYKKGDWEKHIQPVTDAVTKKHGLEKLTFDENRIGESYASWAAKKENKLSLTDIVKADVDYAIGRADSYEAFFQELLRMNYQITRHGYSGKDGQEYFSLLAPGAKRARKNTRLGAGYTVEEIKQRIFTREGSKGYEKVMENLHHRAERAGFLKQALTQRAGRTYRRLYQAVSFYKLPNPYAVPAYQVRKDMINFDKLLEECRYLKEHPVKSFDEYKKRHAYLEEQISLLAAMRKTLYHVRDSMNQEQKDALKQYRFLLKEIQKSEQAGDDRFEELDDALSELESQFPKGMFEVPKQIGDLTLKMKLMRKEKQILNRLLEAEKQAARKQNIEREPHP